MQQRTWRVLDQAPDSARDSQEMDAAADTQLFTRGFSKRLISTIVIAVLAYCGLLFYADLGELARNVGNVHWPVYCVALALSLGNYLLRFVRWHVYLRKLGLLVPIVDSALVFLGGFAMTITPGKMGELLKSLLLKNAYNIPVARSGPVVVAERITDLTGLLILGGLGFMALKGGWVVSLLCFGAVAAVSAICMNRRIGERCLELCVHVPRVRRLEVKLRTAYDTLLDVTKLPLFLFGNGLSVVAWGLQSLSVLTFAATVPGLKLSVAHALVAYCAPLLAGTVSLIPGGLGLTEASMTGAIVSLGGSRATPAAAAAITILVRLVSFWIAILLGLVALGFWRLKRARPIRSG